MQTNPRLGFYVRLDASNRMISGSGLWRLKPPRTGKWQLVPGTVSDLCCGFTTSS